MSVEAQPSQQESKAGARKDGDAVGGALQERQKWMSVLAKANSKMLANKVAGLKGLPNYAVIRPAESGSVMVRGRAGGTGSPFNLGEMSVTRCVVQLNGSDKGAVIGHAYVTGRDKRHAESAALLDALLQTAHWRPIIQEAIIAPLAQAAESERRTRREKVAATKVNFFTMVRGED